MHFLVFAVNFLLATSTFANPVSNNIVDVLKRLNQDRVSIILQAIQVAGLSDTLQGDGPFMLFVPVNDAFKALPDGTLAKLIAAPADLKKILLNHVVKGNTQLSDLKTANLTNLGGGLNKIVVSADKTVTVDNAKVLIPMNMSATIASNGVIHYVDRVLLPTSTTR